MTLGFICEYSGVEGRKSLATGVGGSAPDKPSGHTSKWSHFEGPANAA